MLKLLLVVATPAEASFLSKTVKSASTGKLLNLEKSSEMHLDVLITGVGITATAYHLTKTLSANRYDLAINIGICGTLDPDISPVRVVNITEDQFADFGAEDGKNFLDVFETGLVNRNEPPFRDGILKATIRQKPGCLKAVPEAKGITVQRVHGSESTVRAAFQRYGPVMESMEGAAFFYVCRMEKIPCLQLRAVSNKVEKRNRNKWKIKEAIDALAGFTSLLLLELKAGHSKE